MMTVDRMFQEISPMATCSFKANLFQLLRRANLSSRHVSSSTDLEGRENKSRQRSWALNLGLAFSNTRAAKSDFLVFITCMYNIIMKKE